MKFIKSIIKQANTTSEKYRINKKGSESIMDYPMFANYAVTRKKKDNHYEIENILNESQFRISEYMWQFASQLDGYTDPYEIKGYSEEEADRLIDELDSYSLLRRSNVLDKSLLGILYTISYPEVTPKRRFYAYIRNFVLLVSWLPVLIAGTYAYFTHSVDFDTGLYLLGSLCGVALGLFLHESAHAAATMAYDGKYLEMGIMFSLLTPGAYVLIDTKNIKSRLKNAQINAAGIEMNFLLTGISLLLAARFEILGGFFIGIALNNALLALFNLSLINGLDGAHILCNLFGSDNLFENAKKALWNKRCRQKLMKEGISGYAFIASGAVLSIFQLLLPVLYLTYIIEIVEMIF